MSTGAPIAGVPECPNLASALHRLDAALPGQGWNHGELAGLVDAALVTEAAVLVGLVPRTGGTTVLLTRRTEALRNHGGQVSFPGGRVEATDDGAIGAALREAEEEIGVAAAQVTLLGLLDPLATITGFRIVPVVGLIDPAYVARPDPAEVAEVFEVALEFLLDPGNLATHSLLYRGLPRDVLEFRYPPQRIWGATASILWNLRQRLENCHAH